MGSKNNNSQAVKAGLGYTIGNILIKGINFLTLPIFARLLTTDEFGVYNVFISYEAILLVLISMAIYISLRSAKLEFPNQIDKYVSSVSIIFFINAGFYIALTAFFGKHLSTILNIPVGYIFLLIMYSFSGAVIMLYNTKAALDYSFKQYLKISFVNSIGNISLSLLLILTVFSNYRDLGRILGATSVSFIISIVILVYFYRSERPKYNKAYWKFGLKYSLPIVPHGVSQVLLSQFDRIMIRNIVSSSAAGIYSLAGNIRLILVIITDSIATSWQTWFYEEIEKNNIAEIKLRAKQIICLFAILCIAVMTVSPELVAILGGRNYENAKYVTSPMVIDAFILFVYNIIIPAEYYKKKTNYVMLGTLFATALNIITNYIFIHKYGFIAAAYTTLFSYVCYLIMHLFISHKVVQFDVVEIPFLIGITMIISLNGFISTYYSNSLVIRWGFGLSLLLFFIIVLNRKYDILEMGLKVIQTRKRNN